jgi:hypothetical protein
MHRTSRRAVIVAVALALAGPACSKGSSAAAGTPSARPSSPAKIAFLSPTNGQVFTGGTVSIPVKLSLSGARIVQQTSTHITPTTGHVHLYLDNQIVSMNYRLDATVPGVKPGQHILRAEFVAADHLPFEPRVLTLVTFTVSP